MNYFDDDDKNGLMYEITEFLKAHSISVLLEVVKAAVEYHEDWES